jgi:hypothetical protein
MPKEKIDIPEKDLTLIKWADEIADSSKDAMKPYHDAWEMNWRYFRGDQWHYRSRPKGMKQATANLIKPLVNNTIAHMTTVRPTVRAQPLIRDAKTVWGADLFNNLFPAIWDELHINMIQSAMQLNAHLSQGGFIQCYYDHRANNGMGGYRIRERDTFSCFPDPACKTPYFDEDAMTFYMEEPVSLAYIRTYFPDKAEDVWKAGGNEDDITRSKARYSPTKRMGSFKAQGYTLHDADTTVGYEGTKSEDYISGEQDPKFTTLKILKVRDDFQKAQFKHFRKNKEGFRRLQFEEVNTRWRTIVYTSGNILLYDGPSVFYNGRLGLHYYTAAEQSGHWLGQDEVGQCISLQDEYNDILSDIMEHNKRVIHPRTFFDPGAVKDESWLASFTRRLIPTNRNPNQSIFVDRPNVLGNENVELLNRIPQIMEMILAQPEILQGIRPTGARSGEFIKELASQAMPRTTKKVIRFEQSTAELAESIFLDFLSSLPPVVERIVGGSMSRFYPQDLMDLKLKIEITPGSSMANYADQKISRIVAIVQALQGADPNLAKMVLSMSDIPELREMSDNYQPMPAALPPGEGGQEGTQAQQIPINAAL